MLVYIRIYLLKKYYFMETEQNNIKNEEKNSKNDKEINENYDFVLNLLI